VAIPLNNAPSNIFSANDVRQESSISTKLASYIILSLDKTRFEPSLGSNPSRRGRLT
jgi:hypothetical protein